MDQARIGKFMAELRRKKGLTQEALGERIGTSNKTISRWENGDYMPSIEMLPIIANEFHISVNELLAGQRLDETEFRRVADENVLQIGKTSSFSMNEKKKYFIQKWRREHIALFVLLGIILAGAIILPLVLQKPAFVGCAPLIAFVEYGYQNNAMMTYVENSIYRE